MLGSALLCILSVPSLPCWVIQILKPGGPDDADRAHSHTQSCGFQWDGQSHSPGLQKGVELLMDGVEVDRGQRAVVLLGLLYGRKE